MKNLHTHLLSFSLAATVVFGAACGGSQPVEEAATVETAVEAEVTQTAEATTENAALRAALAHPLRTDAEKARDVYRHPYETLEFFGVKPDQNVLELWAGGGWYTRVLAPYVAPTGKLHVTTFQRDSEREYYRKMAAAMYEYVGQFEQGSALNVIEVNPAAIDFGVEGQVDVALTFRNIHNWVGAGIDKAVYEATFKALKPGGVFGVVEHRGKPGMTREESAKSGYMDQATVIADIEAVGFKLVEASEINANPNDTKDHPEGVWTLPPSLRLGEVDREKYVAMGESDRMTLKFIKPE